MANVFIWRESVYKNYFMCNECGHRVADKYGEPKDNTLVDIKTGIIYCGNCKNPVAHFHECETDLPSGLYGDINEFLSN